MTIKSVYFDYGFTLAQPNTQLEKRFFYLDWRGIDHLLSDPVLRRQLAARVGQKELEEFFEREVRAIFVAHEDSDLIDLQSNALLLEKLSMLFTGPVDQALVDRVLSHLDTMKYFDIDRDVPQVLAELKESGFRMSIISNMMLPGRLLVAKLRREGVLDYFDTVTISSDVGYIKPHRQIYVITLEKDNLRPWEVAFVGDNYRQDIVGAKSAGLLTIWLHNQQAGEELVETGDADFQITSLREIPPLLRAVNKG